VRFKVTEQDYMSWMKQGNKVLSNGASLTLILADNIEFESKGRITNSLNQVDPKTGTLELQASFPNPKHSVLPGQFGRVRVKIEERTNAIAIPQRAVQQLQNMQMVYTLGAEDKVQMQAVTTGYRSGSLWVIEQGLKPGDRVIVEGQLKVRPGVQANPQPYHASTDPGQKAGN